MTKEQYALVSPYKEICNRFAKARSYVGGADGLMDIYKDMFNLGKKVNTGCISCVAAVLLDIHNKIEEYERNLPSV